MLTSLIRNLKILPRWVIIVIDLAIISLSVFFAFLLRFNFQWSDIPLSMLVNGIFLYFFSALMAILISGSYRGIIRYTGIQDGVRIFGMLVLNVLIVSVINLIYYYNTRTNLLPYSVILISFFSSFLLLFNYRLLVKYIFSYYLNAVLKKSRVLIYGAGLSGMLTKQVIDSSGTMQVVGFLEDDIRKAGKTLSGTQIYLNENIEYLLKALHVDELVITIKNLSFERKTGIVDICLRNRVKVRTIPHIERWIRNELNIRQIKDINIEDLLGRETIHISNENVRRELMYKTVCVTGAAGSIGSEIVRQIIGYNPLKIILIDQNESALYELEREFSVLHNRLACFSYIADITNSGRIETIFEEHRPQIIFHAAAYKHVPMMESNPSEAVMCNVLGTKIIADLAVKYHAEKFVMISTDKAINPTSVMGCSKRIAEIYVQALNRHLLLSHQSPTRFVTTRFGNVLGSNGSVIPLFKKQIEAGGPVTVTHPEITRYFMTIHEACQLVLEAAAMGQGGEVFIFDMGWPVKIVDLAHRMIRLSGLEPGKDIDIVYTGLREGEKLYEELIHTKENTIPTHNTKILKAKVSELEYNEINSYINLFWDLIHDKNELKMVALMKEIVPEFKSNYSRYEILDRNYFRKVEELDK